MVDLGAAPIAVEATVIGGPDGLLPPTSDLAQGNLFFEPLEGMLVTVKGPTAVGPTTSFGEIFTVVDNDNDPTNGTAATGQTDRGNMLITPGEDLFGNIDTVGGDYNPERIQIDDDSGILPGFVTPSVNVGARLGDVTGVVNYDFGNYQVVATQAYTVAQASTITKETGTLTDNGREQDAFAAADLAAKYAETPYQEADTPHSEYMRIRLAETGKRNAEVLTAMGMSDRLLDRPPPPPPP